MDRLFRRPFSGRFAVACVAVTIVCGCKQTVQERVNDARKDPSDLSWYAPSIKAAQAAIIRFRTDHGHWPKDENELLGTDHLDVNYNNAHGFVSEPLVPPDFRVRHMRRKGEVEIFNVTVRGREVEIRMTSEDWWWASQLPKG